MDCYEGLTVYQVRLKAALRMRELLSMSHRVCPDRHVNKVHVEEREERVHCAPDAQSRDQSAQAEHRSGS